MDIRHIASKSALSTWLFSTCLLWTCLLGAIAPAEAQSEPIGFWRFDEGAGTTVLDASGWNNSGTLAGRPTRTTSPVGDASTDLNGRALRFNGTTRQYANIANECHFDFAVGDSITLAAWIKPTKLLSGYSETIIVKGRVGSSYNRNFQLYVKGVSTSAGRLGFLYKDVNGSENTFQATSNSIFLNTWSHVAFTYTFGSRNTAVLYVNGRPVAASWNGSSKGVASPANNDDNLTIGAEKNAPAKSRFDGVIDEVGIYEEARSSIQIQVLMPPLTISQPAAYQVLQRNGWNLSSISISGTYKGSPSMIQAQWNGGSWTDIQATFNADGTYSGTLENQPAGQGTLHLQMFYADGTRVTASRNSLGIGDIFVVAGQSNASGRGFENQTYFPPDLNPTLNASLLGNNDEWGNVADPVDSSAGQIDSVSNDGNNPKGSVWPLVGTHFLQHFTGQDVPVAFVPVAKGSSTISQWQRNDANPGSTTTLYGSMHRRIGAAGGKVQAVLFWQGESDAYNGTPRDTYKFLLIALADDIYGDFGVKTMVAQIGQYTGVPEANLQAIRLAQEESWNEHPTSILPGPILYDVNLSDEAGDGVHFKSNSDLQEAASRWWAAIQAAY